MDDFYLAELRNALKEQEFGIVSSRIDDRVSGPNSAHAVVRLIEQREIRVRLSNRGYEITDGVNADSGTGQFQPPIFETLDDLLLAASPAYGERRTKEIVARLSQVMGTSSQRD